MLLFFSTLSPFMDASFGHKRHLDTTTTLDTSTASTPTKRRHQLLPSSATPPSNSFRTPPPPPPPFLKLSPGEAFFRILCPADKTGGVIGKGGAIIRQVREETGAKIRIDDSLSGCDERVIVVIADSTKKDAVNSNLTQTRSDSGSLNVEELAYSAVNDESSSQAQRALIRVLERILKVDEEGNAVQSEGEGRKDEFSDVRSPQGVVVCRLLAPSNQVGSVLGKGGKIIEKIRQETGAQVRVLPKDQLPACALPGDELIQAMHFLYRSIYFFLISCFFEFNYHMELFVHLQILCHCFRTLLFVPKLSFMLPVCNLTSMYLKEHQ